MNKAGVTLCSIRPGLAWHVFAKTGCPGGSAVSSGKNKMKPHIVLLAIFLVLMCGCSKEKQDCEVKDISGAKTDQDLKTLKLMGEEWMKKALVCRMGEFEIATPADGDGINSNIIFVFKKGKPVFHRLNSGTYVYSPKLKDASFEKVMVHIWHGGDNDDVNRIWYQTIGKDPEVMIYDKNFDGQPDLKTVWKNREITEVYEWKNDRWQRKEVRKGP